MTSRGLIWERQSEVGLFRDRSQCYVRGLVDKVRELTTQREVVTRSMNRYSFSMITPHSKERKVVFCLSK